MLTHPRSYRQGRTRHTPKGPGGQPANAPISRPGASLVSSPEIMDTNSDEPATLDLAPHIHAAGNGGGYVDRCRIQHFPSELVLAPVVIVVEGSLGLGYAAREVVPHAPVLAGPPVIVVGIPGSRVLHRSSRACPFSDVGDPDLAPAAERHFPVREGHPVPTVSAVVGSPHPARIARGGRLVRVLAGGRVLCGLRLPLIVYPRTKSIGLSLRQKLLYV